MNKNDLTQFIKETAGLNRTQAEKALNAALEGITAALEKKEDVSLVGFGSFTVVRREARVGQNLHTKEKINIPASNQIKFKVSKNLKESVNQ